MYQVDILLRPQTGYDIILERGSPAGVDIYLSPRAEIGHDIILSRQQYGKLVVAEGGPGFPTQFFGLKMFYQAAIRDLCLVAEADAPPSMGGVLKVRKGATSYVAYLVEVTDPEASPFYIRTTTGTKAIRKKT